MLVGRGSWIRNKLQLDLGLSYGAITVGERIHEGQVGGSRALAPMEGVRAVAEEKDVEDEIRELDLAGFHKSPLTQERLRAILLHRQDLY